MTIVLIGPPAAGKSRVGRRLAERLGLEFLDTDQQIVNEHGRIPDIFATHGEAHFRTLERTAVRTALQQDAVVSLGGGAVLDPDTRSELAQKRVVLLTISPEAVAARIVGDKRPLVRSLEDWQRLVDERSVLYASLATYTVDTSDRSSGAIVDEIVRRLEEE